MVLDKVKKKKIKSLTSKILVKIEIIMTRVKIFKTLTSSKIDYLRG